MVAFLLLSLVFTCDDLIAEALTDGLQRLLHSLDLPFQICERLLRKLYKERLLASDRLIEFQSRNHDRYQCPLDTGRFGDDA